MSWVPVQPYKASPALSAPVLVALTKAGRFKPQIIVYVRTRLLEELAFFHIGKSVDVFRGEGEHAGMVRVVPGSAFKIRRAGGRVIEVAAVRFEAPAGIGGSLGHRATAVEFEHNDDWLEITLPDWAKPPAVGPAPTPARAEALAKPVKPPYVGITARVPDPAQAIQAKAGGRVR